ncbi:MAG: lamin tail domain-containing protein [Ignavibacteria bacterium]|nr:lamin tail domain-containing protein [Ignavibacteria bacterium]
MKKFLILLLLLSTQIFSQRKDTLVIFSEVMFNNLTSIANGEFIELFNTSYTDTINLAGWKIKYYTSTADQIIDAGSGTKLLPRQFAVIFEGDYAGGYSVPSNALVLKISDNAFGTSGMANTTDRDIHLLNTTNDTVWSYVYSANNSAGYSDEKIILIGDNSPSNWANSIVLNGTPGSKNSVSPKEYDLGITRFVLAPSFPVMNDNVEVSVWIKNFGIRSATNFSVRFRFDLDNDGVFDFVFNSNTISSLSPNDSINVKSDSLIRRINSVVRVFTEIIFSPDENKLNDTLTFFIKPGLTPRSVLISEIMFDPKSGEPEWVEIYNNTDSRINLRGWKVSDVLANPTIVNITNNDFYFEPRSLLVLAANLSIRNFYDTIPSPILVVSIPALNNDKDGVVIYDDRGLVIDSVFYFSDWGSSKKSIERISYEQISNLKSNWAPSISDSGATPGKPNSITKIQPGNQMSVVINEIMYEPLTGFAEYIEIYNASNDSINLAGWRLVEGGGKTFNLSTRTFYLKKDEFMVVASDSSILNLYPYLIDYARIGLVKIMNSSDLSLSNSGDIVVLRDIFGNTIDSVAYSPKWHNPEIDDSKGRSLEKINPTLNSNDGRNWSTSVNPNGGSPLKTNSIFISKISPTSKIEISPNPFSPDNDGFEDFAVINYELPLATSQIRIRIFDSVGRLVRTLADNEPTASKGSITFDGLDDNKQPLRIGIYVLLLEAINQQNGVIETVKKPIVVAKRLK